jgi:hypothetical protein
LPDILSSVFAVSTSDTYSPSCSVAEEIAAAVILSASPEPDASPVSEGISPPNDKSHPIRFISTAHKTNDPTKAKNLFLAIKKSSLSLRSAIQKTPNRPSYTNTDFFGPRNEQRKKNFSNIKTLARAP